MQCTELIPCWLWWGIRHSRTQSCKMQTEKYLNKTYLLIKYSTIIQNYYFRNVVIFWHLALRSSYVNRCVRGTSVHIRTTQCYIPEGSIHNSLWEPQILHIILDFVHYTRLWKLPCFSNWVYFCLMVNWLQRKSCSGRPLDKDIPWRRSSFSEGPDNGFPFLSCLPGEGKRTDF